MGLLTGSISSELANTVALLDAAANAKVVTRRIRWESMERVLRLLRTSFKESDTNPLAAREASVVSSAWAWARVCMDGPVTPGHWSTGLSRLYSDMQSAIDSVGGQRLQSLRDAVERVAAAPHPASETLVELIGNGPQPRDERAGTVLVVRGEGLPGVREWCDEVGLVVDVVKVSEARLVAPWPNAILFGPPDRYSKTPWITSAQAAATSGWLLAAPVAPAVTVLSWTGHRPMTKGAYQPWKGAPSGEVVEGSAVEVLEEDFLPDSLDSFRPIATPSFRGEEASEVVDAVGMQFRVGEGNVFAYFHPSIGAKPQVVTFEDGHAVVTSRNLKFIREGRCLLFRTAVAGKDALDSATVVWLKRHKKEFAADTANARRQELKEAVRRFREEQGHPALTTALQAQGIDINYARSFGNRMLDPDYIAPQHEDVYFRVCRAVGLTVPQNSFKLLKTLRIARRRAGADLVTQIAGRLDELPDVPDMLRDEGAVTLREPGLEGVVLLVVRAIASEVVSVPAWRLGSVLDAEGHAWHP
jgi:hypothetical protein